MTKILDHLANEPARVVAAVLALVGLATAFGLGITDGQQASIVAAVGAVLALLGGETVRAQVTPTRKTDPLTTSDGKRPKA